MNAFASSQIILIGQKLQSILDERFTSLRDHCKPLPFSNVNVVEYSTVVRVVLSDLTSTLQKDLLKEQI